MASVPKIEDKDGTGSIRRTRFAVCDYVEPEEPGERDRVTVGRRHHRRPEDHLRPEGVGLVPARKETGDGAGCQGDSDSTNSTGK